jgi:hypothetical protein
MAGIHTVRAQKPFAYLRDRDKTGDQNMFFWSFFETAFIRQFAKSRGDWRAMFASTADADAFLEDLRNHPGQLRRGMDFFLEWGVLDMRAINEMMADNLKNWDAIQSAEQNDDVDEAQGQ